MNLVTGGGGFIGSHLVQLLVARGEEVRVLELPDANVSRRIGVEIVRGDIRDRASVRAAVRDCRFVYHLAANPNLWTRRRADFDDVNRLGTVHVLEESLEQGAQRVVHVSTESILTSPAFDGGAVETFRPRREDIVGPYCLSKFEAERFAFQLADSGAPVVIACPTLPVGPGDVGLSPPTRMTLACARGRLWAYLDCRLNMIDARDVALGLVRTMQIGLPGRRYLLGAWNVELVDWLRMVSAAVGRRPPRWRVPYPIALAAGYVSEWIADHLTRRMPNATVTGVRLTRYCMHFDPSRTLAELGLKPRPLEESLADFIAEGRRLGRL